MKTQQYDTPDIIGSSLVLDTVSQTVLLNFFGAKERFGQLKLENTIQQLQPTPKFYDELLEVQNLSARQFQSVVELVPAKEWLVFGGKANGYLNDVQHVKRAQYSYNCQLLTISGEAPSPRYGHCAVRYKNKMFIYGGYDNNSFTCNDLCSMDVEQFSWNKESCKLPARLHAASCLIGNMWYISGGLDDTSKPASDMFAINLDTMQVVDCKGTFAPRFGHAMVQREGTLLIVGGLKQSNMAYPEILQYVNEEWHFLASPDDLPWKGFARCVFKDDVLHVVGGSTTTSLVGRKKIWNDLPKLSDDVTLYMLKFCNRKELNTLIASSKNFAICKLAAHNSFWLHLMVKYSLPLDVPNFREHFRQFKSKFDVQCNASNTKGTLQAVLKAIPSEYHHFAQRRNAVLPTYVNVPRFFE